MTLVHQLCVYNVLPGVATKNTKQLINQSQIVKNIKIFQRKASKRKQRNKQTNKKEQTKTKM